MTMRSTYRVVGVRHDGTRRVLVAHLSEKLAAEIAKNVKCDVAFPQVLVEAESPPEGLSAVPDAEGP